MTTAEGHGIGKYLAVYVCLLVVMAVQFLMGYQNVSGSGLVVRMLTFGVIETILVVVFWMNLGLEKPMFIKFIVFFTGFVLLALNYGWTDGFRIFLFRLTGIGPS